MKLVRSKFFEAMTALAGATSLLAGMPSTARAEEADAPPAKRGVQRKKPGQRMLKGMQNALKGGAHKRGPADEAGARHRRGGPSKELGRVTRGGAHHAVHRGSRGRGPANEAGRPAAEAGAPAHAAETAPAETAE